VQLTRHSRLLRMTGIYGNERREMTRRALGAVVVAFAAALALSACGSSLPSGLSGKSDRAIVEGSYLASLKEKSVRLTLTQNLGGSLLTQVTQSSTNDAISTINGQGLQGTITVVNRRIYVQGNAAFLQKTFVTVADVSAYVNRPIEVPPTDSNYKVILGQTIFGPLMFNYFGLPPYSNKGQTTFMGVKSLKFTGETNQTMTLLGVGPTSSYFISLTSPFYPVGASGTGSGPPRTTVTMRFDHWGLSVTVVAPSGAVVSTSTPLG